MDEPVVLIVDDEPVGLRTLDALLTNENYQLEFASDGPSALAKADLNPPDLVLLDVMMPGMDGFEVCRRLRQNPKVSDVPVVLVTALDDPEARLLGIQAGADDFVSKPFDRAELRARVRTITRLNRYRKIHDAYRELHASYEATLQGWIKALDLRDKETEGHSRRVTELATDMARALGIVEPALSDIRRGALLHDIGKIGIPDGILLKPGSLTDGEWVIMKQHPEIARDMLAGIAYLFPAIDIPYCHHEKWDGSGYPRGLHGDEIPLGARIFAYVDVWDALTHDRPYRKAWSGKEALEHIERDLGKHFDPALWETFRSLPKVQEFIQSTSPPDPPKLPAQFSWEIGELPGNVCVLRLSGFLQLENCAALSSQVNLLTKSGHKRFVIDLTKLNYLGSTGMRVFFYLAASVKGLGKVCMFNPNPMVREALEVVHAFKVLPVYISETEAADAARCA